MSGLDSAQLDELEQMVSKLAEEPWDKGEGRPRELTLREALVVTCGYLRQNIIEDVWADIFDVAQSTISRYITFLTPLIEKATEEDRPAAEDAAKPPETRSRWSTARCGRAGPGKAIESCGPENIRPRDTAP
jgi:hypothetical protein